MSDMENQEISDAWAAQALTESGGLITLLRRLTGYVGHAAMEACMEEAARETKTMLDAVDLDVAQEGCHRYKP